MPRRFWKAVPGIFKRDNLQKTIRKNYHEYYNFVLYLWEKPRYNI